MLLQYITLPKKAIDLTGQRFGRLIALGAIGKTKRNSMIWECQCDCGNLTAVETGSLRAGLTRSCGCLNRELVVSRGRYKGLSRHPLYRVWRTMINRCTNPRVPSYRNYGERGITIFAEWLHDFRIFYDYVTQLPDYGEKGYTLDRADNSQGYYPGNVRWASPKTQGRNTRRNIIVTHNGKTQSATAWAEELHFNPRIISIRLRSGWSVERALTTPAKTR